MLLKRDRGKKTCHPSQRKRGSVIQSSSKRDSSFNHKLKKEDIDKSGDWEKEKGRGKGEKKPSKSTEFLFCQTKGEGHV